jgi:hypothetical protein
VDGPGLYVFPFFKSSRPFLGPILFSGYRGTSRGERRPGRKSERSLCRAKVKIAWSCISIRVHMLCFSKHRDSFYLYRTVDFLVGVMVFLV